MTFVVIAALALLLTPQATPADYLGDGACQSCHESYSYTKTKHADAANARTPAATHGCESCHGAGRAHAEAGDPTKIRNPGSLPPKEAAAVCSACHERVAHAGDAACTSCHSVHHATAAKLLKRAAS